MPIKSFLQGTFKIALAISIALILTIGIVGGAMHFYYKNEEKNKIKEAEIYSTPRHWKVNVEDSLKVRFFVDTKYFDGKMYSSVVLVGGPEYMDVPGNYNKEFFLIFLDKDNFEVYRKSVPINYFTTSKNSEEITGYTYQYNESQSLELYKKFDAMSVEWTVNPHLTKPVAELPRPPAPKPVALLPSADPCAPGISKSERLRRLAAFGNVRQTGQDDYSAGGHEIVFFSFDDSLLNCR